MLTGTAPWDQTVVCKRPADKQTCSLEEQTIVEMERAIHKRDAIALKLEPKEVVMQTLWLRGATCAILQAYAFRQRSAVTADVVFAHGHMGRHVESRICNTAPQAQKTKKAASAANVKLPAPIPA